MVISAILANFWGKEETISGWSLEENLNSMKIDQMTLQTTTPKKVCL